MQSTRSRALAVCLALVASQVVGCGGGKKKPILPTAKVTGKVTHAGKPVTAGQVSLVPEDADGTAGVADVGEDGTLGSFTTYGSGDGVNLGTVNVQYFPPEDTVGPEDESGHSAVVPSPYAGLVPKVREVEVEEGGTELTIELVKP